ncbi:DUF2397 family protein [Cryobacterium frigoriphilum]|uniref:DUF2397 family protein n=1 Tax=Cryobacterium frigoriphilum TaxID=1259150 RepID=A0A4R9A0D3_9MICO|nr:DUF2397 domain-containing protein [Cryobacterium frigoriphilum]TFD49618.1 DUF2397 family protein [Cryobacterium frigoriphilum]
MVAEPESAELSRLSLYAHLHTEQTEQHRRIMRLLSGEILTREMSAAEIASELVASGFPITEDEVESRCTQLKGWGNVIPSIRNYRVTTIAELRRAKSRYQASKLGARVTSQSDDIVNATDGAKEVARELMGVIAEQLTRILEEITGGNNPDLIAAAVTTTFNSHREFRDSLRDFTAYLAGILSRYDIVGDEYLALKATLMRYIDILGTDVRQHAPRISALLTHLEPHFPGIINTLAVWQTLTVEGTELSQGRTASDWAWLGDWYAADGHASGPVAFRAATEQALGQLLVNAKRIVTDAGSGHSRRNDLLRLAKRFNIAEDEEAHRLFANSFGVYSWRHLLLGDDEKIQPSANTSWWNAPNVEVPISLRERGDRSARGRTATVRDAILETQLAHKDAIIQMQRRQLATVELIEAGTLDGVRLSAAAQELLHAQLTLIDQSTDISENLEAGFRLHREPIIGVSTILFDEGVFTVHGHRLTVTSIQSQVRKEATA